MNRREFIAGSMLSSVLFEKSAFGKNTCSNSSPWQPAICTAEVDLNDIIYAAQEQSFWCWAAAAQMVFSIYGYSISQETIVAQIYGSVTNLPSGPTSNISSLLNREWQDDDGNRFYSRLSGLYDVFNGISHLNNFQIVNALAFGKPLFYCNRSHAMVQTAIVYSNTPQGLQIHNIGLIDPWPGIGPRGPQYGEMTPAHLGGTLTYLAYPIITSR